MSFPRYPAYKPSGVEWLGEVPEHWEIKRVRRIFEIKKRIAGELGFDILSITQQGIKVRDPESNDGQLSMDYSKYQVVEPGDFAMNHMDLLTGYVDISRILGVTSPDYRVFSMVESCNSDPGYLLYVFQMGYRQKILYAYGQGSSQLGRWRLPTKEFQDWAIPFPSQAEQAAVATFLDRETAKIDALIAEQQRLIELLQEKRQAVISHAVTKGLNPDAPMKDSGVEWLGEVPEYWEVTPLKHLATIQTGIAKGKDLEDMETIDVPYLRVANVQDGYLSLDEVHLLTVPVASIDRYLLKVGDVLMNEGGDFDKLGRGCIWSGEIAPCVHQNHVFAVRPHLASGEWLNAFTTSKAANSYFISRSKQSTNLASISSTNLMGLPVPLPPAEEAREILGRLNQLINEIDDLKHSAIQAIALLQERRSALISAAVTGQIDVRGLVPEASAA
jgi:type I restriction enzyme S subunit